MLKRHLGNAMFGGAIAVSEETGIKDRGVATNSDTQAFGGRKYRVQGGNQKPSIAPHYCTCARDPELASKRSS